MKEAIGGVSLFQVVIVFLLVFTGIMCLTINHSKAFGVKDEIINVIEKNVKKSGDELNSEVVSKIAEHLQNAGYRTTGNCGSEDWIGYNLAGIRIGEGASNAAFCVRAVDVKAAYQKDAEDKCNVSSGCQTTESGMPPMYYYDIAVFYQLDIPVLKHVLNLKLVGSTKVIYG